MGRGGTGKTSFVALMARYLIENGATPLLLVDADPDQNLAEMVGVDLESAGRKTIAELLSETFITTGGTMIGIPRRPGSEPDLAGGPLRREAVRSPLRWHQMG